MGDLEKDTWNVIYTYFKDNKNYISRHHLDSYNDFIKNKIPQTLKQYNDPPLRLYIEKIKSNVFRHTISIYFGGKTGDKIYLSQPVVYDAMNKRWNNRFMTIFKMNFISLIGHLFAIFLF